MAEEPSPGGRIQSARKRRGLTQNELAELSGVSVSLIRKLEQGERTDVRVETLRRLAVAMEVPTTALMAPAREPDEEANGTLWASARQAILRPHRRDTPESVTERGLADALTAAVKLYHDNRYGQLAQVLPGLLTDAEDASPLLRSRVLQLAGSVMVQTRQREPAHAALDRALAEAEQAGNVLPGRRVHHRHAVLAPALGTAVHPGPGPGRWMGRSHRASLLHRHRHGDVHVGMAAAPWIGCRDPRQPAR